MDKESNWFRRIRVYAQIYGLALFEDNALTGSQMCIVTGPRIDLAIALVHRMKKLLIGKIYTAEEIEKEGNIILIPSIHYFTLLLDLWV